MARHVLTDTLGPLGYRLADLSLCLQCQAIERTDSKGRVNICMVLVQAESGVMHKKRLVLLKSMPTLLEREVEQEV